MTIADGVYDLCANPSHYALVLRGEVLSLGERGVVVRPFSDHLEVVAMVGGRQSLLCLSSDEGYVGRLSRCAEAIERLYGGFELMRQCRVVSLRHRDYGFVIDVAVCGVVDGVAMGRYVRGASELQLDSVYHAIAALEDDLSSVDCSFETLSGDDLVVAATGELHPTTLRGLRGRSGREAFGCCDDLRRWVARESGVEMPAWSGVCGVSEARVSGQIVDGHLWCGAPREERIAVRDESGYGFVDMENCVVVESRFLSVTSFGEGRAVVESERGYGLIDLWGRFVIEDIYDDMSYSPSRGVTVAKLDGLWGRFNYRGELISPFVSEFPVDEIFR